VQSLARVPWLSAPDPICRVESTRKNRIPASRELPTLVLEGMVVVQLSILLKMATMAILNLGHATAKLPQGLPNTGFSESHV